MKFIHGIKQLKFVALLAFILLAFLVPFSFAHAECGISTSFSLSDCIIQGWSLILSYAVSAVAIFIGALAKTLDGVLRFTINADMPVLHNVWTIVRNFSNMFFIVMLIIMAFATIFDVGSFGYAGYDINSMIGKFLIVALLINFSLVISGVIISGINTVNSVFLAGINNFADRLGAALDPSFAILGISSKNNPSNVPTTNDIGLGLIVRQMFSLMMALIIAFSLLVALIVSLARVPIIWILLVFAPIAWLCSILPATKQYNSMWWKYFWGWNFFLPIFLFFLYVGLSFLGNQDVVMASVGKQFQTAALSGNDIWKNSLLPSANASLQVVFFYFTAAFIVLGGTAMALKTSILAGSGVVAVAQGARGWLKNTTGIGGFQKAFAEKKAEIQRQGLRIGGVNVAGGPPRGQQFFRRQLGVEGAFASEVNEAKEELKKRGTPIEQLREFAKKGDARGLAAAELLLDAGKLNSEEAKRVFKQYAAISTIAGNAFKEKVARKLNDQAKEGELNNADDLVEFVTTFIKEQADREKFLSKVAKKNALAAVEAFARIQEPDDAGKMQVLIDAQLRDTLSTLTEREIAEQRIPDPSKIADPAKKQEAEKEVAKFKEALQLAIAQNPKQVEKLLNQNMSTRQREVISSAIKQPSSTDGKIILTDDRGNPINP